MTATYAYDALGRRIEKNVNGAITRYVYDQEDILAEYDGTNTLQAKYTHGPGIDEPLIMERGSQAFFYHTDGLGSITAITDTLGTAVKSFQYDSFGNVVTETGTLQQPYGYTGRERDLESGLVYYRRRYYDPGIGRFLQEDPVLLPETGPAQSPFLLIDLLREPQELNSFSYVANNPTTLIDPFGFRGQKERLLGDDPLVKGISKQSSQAEVDQAIKNVKRALKGAPALSDARKKFLRGWLKVAKRGFKFAAGIGFLIEFFSDPAIAEAPEITEPEACPSP
ncbi:MAG: hypothetical protein HY597_06430 [Candidatus Omnitrophica bacterium]|nr:hypothetical protein [Candidatus Omnitrophota bacterium]